MDQRIWLNEEEHRAWRAFMAMQVQLIARLAGQLATDSGLSYSDYEVLVALTDQSDGQLRNYELTECLGWEQSRVSHHIRRMEKRGLVDRVQCPSDKRGSFVQVTSSGRKAIEEAAPGHVGAVRKYLINQLDGGELRALGEISRKVLAGFDADNSNEQ